MFNSAAVLLHHVYTCICIVSQHLPHPKKNKKQSSDVASKDLHENPLVHDPHKEPVDVQRTFSFASLKQFNVLRVIRDERRIYDCIAAAMANCISLEISRSAHFKGNMQKGSQPRF